MDKVLEKKLYDKYPGLLKGFTLSPVQSCLAFGCEHGDGWYVIIENLLSVIENHLVNKNRGKTDKEDIMVVTVDQIKEKFGGLRFYFSGGDEYVSGAVSMAENISYHICEHCGSTKNVTQTKGWIKSLCEECIKEK